MRQTETIRRFEPLKGIEPLTSSLPRKCSTTELQRLIDSHWSQQVIQVKCNWLIWLIWPYDFLPERKTRLPAQCGTTHSLEAIAPNPGIFLLSKNLERKTRLELATYSLEGYRSTKWATSAFSKNYPLSLKLQRCSGQGWIRTTELRRGQIYSLLPLATWLLAHSISDYPISDLRFSGTNLKSAITNLQSREPLVGIEPTTYWLQISCSTSWAKVAFSCPPPSIVWLRI